MKYAIAKKISTQNCYNNEFEIISICGSFDDAETELKNSSTDIIIEISDEMNIGDSINDNGKTWNDGE